MKCVVGFLQLLKTVLFDFAKNAGILTLSGLVIGERIEVYTNCELLQLSPPRARAKRGEVGKRTK